MTPFLLSILAMASAKLLLMCMRQRLFELRSNDPSLWIPNDQASMFMMMGALVLGVVSIILLLIGIWQQIVRRHAASYKWGSLGYRILWVCLVSAGVVLLGVSSMYYWHVIGSDANVDTSFVIPIFGQVSLATLASITVISTILGAILIIFGLLVRQFFPKLG